MLVEKVRENTSCYEPTSDNLVTAYWKLLYENLLQDNVITWKKIMMVIINEKKIAIFIIRSFL